MLEIYFNPAPAFCEDAIGLDALKSQLPDGIELPESLNNVTLPTVNDAKDLFREKCTKISGSDAAFEEAEVNFKRFIERQLNL